MFVGLLLQNSQTIARNRNISRKYVIHFDFCFKLRGFLMFSKGIETDQRYISEKLLAANQRYTHHTLPQG